MYCSHCGQENSPTHKFCTNCGHEISTVRSSELLEPPPRKSTSGLLRKASASIIVTVASILVFILASVGTRFLVTGGGSHQQEVVNRVAEYITDNGEWKEFTSADAHFAALFPRYPSRESEMLSLPGTDITIPYTAYSTEDDISAYIVGVTTYPTEVDVRIPHVILEGALNGMVASTEGNKVTASSITTFFNYPTLTFEILNAEQNIQMKGRIVLVGHTLYMQASSYEIGKEQTADHIKFMNSFNLTR